MRLKILTSLLALAGFAQASVVFYSDQASFSAAVAAAHLATTVNTFESTPVGDYSTSAGLTSGGINYIGPFAPYFLKVYDPATWGNNFAAGTGNTLAGVGEIDITLAPGTYAFGANVGESFTWAAGGSSTVQFHLSTGDAGSTPVSPARLFPFFGFVSTAPIASVNVGFGASFITIDNVTTGVVATPEPTGLALFCLGIAAATCLKLRNVSL